MATQQAFILYATTWGSEKGDIVRDSNLDELNEMLDDGWKVVTATPMSGHGEDDDETRCLVVLESE